MSLLLRVLFRGEEIHLVLEGWGFTTSGGFITLTGLVLSRRGTYLLRLKRDDKWVSYYDSRRAWVCCMIDLLCIAS